MPRNRRLELGRNRAETAFVNAKSGSKEDFKAEYKSLVLKSPALVKTNGLLATAAFLFSKRKSVSGKAHELLYDQIAKWLEKREMVTLTDGGYDDFAKVLTELSYAEVRVATNETLAYLSWLKRFSEGLIDKDKDA